MKLRMMTGMALAATITLIGAPAFADTTVPDDPAPVVEVQGKPSAMKTIRWVLPDGGTPDNVTWPQPIASDANLAAIPCGTTAWLQVDVYPYQSEKDKKRTDRLADDGILTYGEDHGWALSWSFEKYDAPRCVPVQPADDVAKSTVTGDFACGDTTVTDTTTTTTTPYVWDEAAWAWVAGQQTTAATSAVRDLTVDELASLECEVTPTPTPTPDVPVEVPTLAVEAPEAQTALAQAVPRALPAELAETGTDVPLPLIAIAGLLVAGGAFAAFRKRSA